MRSTGQELARLERRKELMKKLLTVGLFMIMAIAASAEPQGLRAPVQRKKAKPQKAPQVTERDVRGVIPRAIRGGNPLQMLNPMAPAKYGTGEQSVAYNPITGKYDQIKLFEILF
jgi:hypothetical protein